MKKEFLAILIMFFLTSCSNDTQDIKRKESINQAIETESGNQQPSEFASEGHTNASTIVDKKLISTKKEKIICVDQDISEWYGFKEQDAENAQCKPIKDYKVISYQCEMRLAFEEGFEAMFVLAPNVTIISYSALDKCNAAKDIWESNAP